MIKKIVAGCLACTIAVTAFVGCGDNKNSDNDNSDGSLSKITIGDKEVDTKDLSLLSLNGEDVSFDELYNYLLIAKNYLEGNNASYWDTTDKASDFEQMLAFSVGELKYDKVVEELKAQYPVELAPETATEIEAQITEMREYFTSLGYEFEDYLASSLMSEDVYRLRLTQQNYLTEICEKLYGENGERIDLDDDEYRKYVDENYVKVQHILISNDHFAEDEAYADKTEEEIATAVLELTNEVLAKVEAGEDFYQLSQEYGDDPGMTDNEEGYTFTYGEMVEEFETASFALDFGAISEPIKTSYGYHIIKRFPISENEYPDLCFNTLINAEMDKIVVLYSEDYEALTFDGIFG